LHFIFHSLLISYEVLFKVGVWQKRLDA